MLVTLNVLSIKMLSIGLLSLLIAVPLFSYRITPSLFNRITSLLLIYAGILSFSILYVENIKQGVGIFSGLFQITNISVAIEGFLFIVGSMLLYGWSSETISIDLTYRTNKIRSNFDYSYNGNHISVLEKIGSEYSLLILFTTIGAAILISSADLVSMFLSIELQSFAVYVLATLYRESESATAAGLKYFLLGGLSSSIILLGTSLIYYNTGLTNFESIYSLISVDFGSLSNSGILGVSEVTALQLGTLLVGIGFLFKVASAPLHNWAPDVYDGTPTIVTAWLSTIPKISIFILLLEFTVTIFHAETPRYNLGSLYVIEGSVWQDLLLLSSISSLVLGTVLGLSQYRIKRLLTYSTISHVGFLLLALAINSEESIESFIFYLVQYSLTNVNTFLVLLAFGYLVAQNVNSKREITFINELSGQFTINPLLSISFAVCLFSMAGIPPLIGFFAKQIVLYSSMHSGYYFLSIVAILVSVISASYYLRIIQVLYFGTQSQVPTKMMEDKETSLFSSSHNQEKYFMGKITNIHSTFISILTIIIILFIFQPIILLNSCHLLALSIFFH